VNWHQGACALLRNETIRSVKIGRASLSSQPRAHVKRKFLSQRGIWRNCKTIFARDAAADF